MSKLNQKLNSGGGREGTARDFPSDRPRELEEILQNFDVNNANIPIDGEAVLYSSLIRTIQQDDDLKAMAKIERQKKKGK